MRSDPGHNREIPLKRTNPEIREDVKQRRYPSTLNNPVSK